MQEIWKKLERMYTYVCTYVRVQIEKSQLMCITWWLLKVICESRSIMFQKIEKKDNNKWKKEEYGGEKKRRKTRCLFMWIDAEFSPPFCSNFSPLVLTNYVLEIISRNFINCVRRIRILSPQESVNGQFGWQLGQQQQQHSSQSSMQQQFGWWECMEGSFWSPQLSKA